MNKIVPPLFHHCIPLSQVRFGTIRADPSWSDAWFLPAYEWLADQIGFFPHFISVGRDWHALYRTGYQDNWKVWTSGEFIDGKYRKHYRTKGEFPNKVLLSFEDLEGIFMDHTTWHIAINACTNGHSVSDRKMRVFRNPNLPRAAGNLLSPSGGTG